LISLCPGFTVYSSDDNRVPGYPPDASASWRGGVLIVWPLDDNKVPWYPPDASASWRGGVLIVWPSDDNKVPWYPPDASASWKGGVLIASLKSLLNCLVYFTVYLVVLMLSGLQ